MMDITDLLKEYEDNGILIEIIDSAVYNLTFDAKYTNSIKYNLNTLGLNSMLFSAKHRALMERDITNHIEEPYVTVLQTSPYEFEINGPFSVMIYFVQRIITVTR